MSYLGFSSYSVPAQRGVTNIENIYKTTNQITKHTVEKNTIVEDSIIVQELRKRIKELESKIESSETKYNSIGTE